MKLRSKRGVLNSYIMNTLSDPQNIHIVSKFTFHEVPAALDDIYHSYIVNNKYPNEEMYHVSALITGFNGDKPEITSWNSNGTVFPISQDNPDNFTGYVIPPYDMTRTACNEILWESAQKNFHCFFLNKTAVDYFKTISSISKFVSENATIWTHPADGTIDIV